MDEIMSVARKRVKPQSLGRLLCPRDETVTRHPAERQTISFLAYMDFELGRFVFGRVLNEGEHHLTCRLPNRNPFSTTTCRPHRSQRHLTRNAEAYSF